LLWYTPTSQEACDEIIDEIAKEINIQIYDRLYSTKEFKKQRIKYFDSAFEEWENKALTK